MYIYTYIYIYILYVYNKHIFNIYITLLCIPIITQWLLDWILWLEILVVCVHNPPGYSTSFAMRDMGASNIYVMRSEVCGNFVCTYGWVGVGVCAYVSVRMDTNFTTNFTMSDVGASNIYVMRSEVCAIFVCTYRWVVVGVWVCGCVDGYPTSFAMSDRGVSNIFLFYLCRAL